MIWKAELVDNPPHYAGRIPGRVVGISSQGGYVDVLIDDGILRIFDVQFEGGKRTSVAKAIRSIRSILGLCISDLLSRIENLEQQIIQLKTGIE